MSTLNVGIMQKFSLLLNFIFFAHILLLYLSGSIYINFSAGNYRRVVIEHEENVLDHTNADLPTIYMITPTYNRDARKADLTRLGQTLRQVPKFHWILIEDGPNKAPLVDRLANRLGIAYTYLAAPTPNYTTLGLANKINKGVYQRNVALEWLRWTYKGKESQWSNAIVYFGDDDNTYDLRLFQIMRTIKKVGVWPVALVGGVKLEKPVINAEGKLEGFEVGFAPKRNFAMDMAGFALNLHLVLERPDGHFPLDSLVAWNEPEMFRSFNLTYDDVMPLGFDFKTPEGKKETLVWHTRTQPVDLGQTKRFQREHQNRYPDDGWEV